MYTADLILNNTLIPKYYTIVYYWNMLINAKIVLEVACNRLIFNISTYILYTNNSFFFTPTHKKTCDTLKLNLFFVFIYMKYFQKMKKHDS